MKRSMALTVALLAISMSAGLRAAGNVHTAFTGGVGVTGFEGWRTTFLKIRFELSARLGNRLKLVGSFPRATPTQEQLLPPQQKPEAQR
jgi:hypothetical protein